MLHRHCRCCATFLALALGGIGLAGCATVPHIGAIGAHSRAVALQVTGPHGRLSQRDTEAILARVAATTPNAGALERHLAVEQAVAESPLYVGNRVRILQDGPETFPAMFAAIRSAQHYLYLEYYIFEDVSSEGTSLGDLLIEKHQAGVEIYLIYDALGSITTPSSFIERLQSAGIHVVQFNPLNPLKAKVHYSINERDHRKMLVADGRVVILGGINLSTAYESAPGTRPIQVVAGAGGLAKQPQEYWRDIDVEITGPIAPELEKLFTQHWLAQHGDPLGSAGATPPLEAPGGEIVRIIGSSPTEVTSRYYVTILTAIDTAEQRVWITAAYFVPTPQENEALLRAARRGIDVRILLPSHSDSGPALAIQRSHYSELLKAGIKLYERTEGILHSKSLVIDGVWAVTGSSNFDHRSVLFNDEVDAVIVGQRTGEQLEHIFTNDAQHAHGIDLASWRQRSLVQRSREKFWLIWEKMF